MKRIAALMDYEKITTIVTYTLQEESEASLKTVGAKGVSEVEPKEWSVPSRPRKSQSVYGKQKWKWKL